jgi:hypothetical protein
VLAAALDELATGAVLVVEDLHWADDATLGPRRAARPAARPLPGLPRADLPHRRARRTARGAAGARRAAARVRPARRARGRSPRAPSPCSRSAPGATRPSSMR